MTGLDPLTFLFGPVYYRLLLSGTALDKNVAPRIVDAFMRAFAPV